MHLHCISHKNEKGNGFQKNSKYQNRSIFVHELSISKTHFRTKYKKEKKIKILRFKNEKLLWYYYSSLSEVSELCS